MAMTRPLDSIYRRFFTAGSSVGRVAVIGEWGSENELSERYTVERRVIHFDAYFPHLSPPIALFMPQPKDPILVTGGSGYIASWIVKYLLADGYHVRATVRDKRKPEKVAHLMQLAMDEPGVLELVEADLLDEGSFDTAMQGCRWVIHTASPFAISKIDDPQKQLIDPALKGTRHVLNSVNRTPSVTKVVLTSSVAAVAGDNSEIYQTDHQIFTEEHWNHSSSLDHQPYPYSKTLAEKEAWRMSGEQDRWQLLVINPSFVMGPSLSGRNDAASIEFMQNFLKGQFRTGAADLTFGIVDVRDVARAHILACERPDAGGRHILVSEHLTLLEIAKALGEVAPQYRSKLPRFNAPKVMMYLVGPILGFSTRFVKQNVGVKVRYDNSYAKQDLGISFRPVQETFRDMVQRMEALGQVG